MNTGPLQGTGTLLDIRDVFSRADKWLGQPPPSGAEKWQTREQEIAGFSDYVVALRFAVLGKLDICGRDQCCCALERSSVAAFLDRRTEGAKCETLWHP